jgi:Cu2+-containing amine oxidase
MELNSLLDMKVRNYMNKLLFYKEREIDLINYYEHQIDSLVSVIDSLPKNKVKKIRK